MYRQGPKRVFDVAASVAGLIVLSPVLLGFAVWIKASDRGSIFYRGVRAGRDGRPFRIYKFRSMVMNAEQLGGSSSPDDDPRITRPGRVLRRYKLDELPQLINVLRGEMSLVGPRPQVLWAVENYDERERRLLSVRPGITDPASIAFRDEGAILAGQGDPDDAYYRLIHPEKVRLSLEYIERMSFRRDLELILATIRPAETPSKGGG